MKKILCIGEALIDMICTDKGEALRNGQNFVKKAGGAPTNVAAAIAALGGQVDLCAKVGVDPFGEHLKNVLSDFKVGLTWFISDANAFTTMAFVSLLENGERDFYFNRGADGQLSIEEVNKIPLGEYDIVHFGSATAFLPGPLQDAYHSLLGKCKNEGKYISFDPNYRQLLFADKMESFYTQSWQFLQAANFFKVSDEEATLLTGCENMEEAALQFMAKTNAVFAITLGSKGTLLGLGDTTYIIPSIPVHPVDTTGAGDAFVGAILYQLSMHFADEIDEQAWKKMTSNANAAGARTCEYFGAMEAFKNLTNEIFR